MHKAPQKQRRVFYYENIEKIRSCLCRRCMRCGDDVRRCPRRNLRHRQGRRTEPARNGLSGRQGVGSVSHGHLDHRAGGRQNVAQSICGRQNRLHDEQVSFRRYCRHHHVCAHQYRHRSEPAHQARYGRQNHHLFPSRHRRKGSQKGQRLVPRIGQRSGGVHVQQVPCCAERKLYQARGSLHR